jgi:hypothetical protein
VSVNDSDPTDLTVANGPITFVSGAVPEIYAFPEEELGPLQLGWNITYTLDNAAFGVSSRFTNLPNLPFPATFGQANVVPGQNVLATTHSLPASNGTVPAEMITLIPQSINGTVVAISTESGFTTYTVQLASYDLFPALSEHDGQNNLLLNADNVVVYADNTTRTLNTTPIAVGSVARFYGLVFNDGGALRMDCAQISDGVPD